MKNFYLTIVSLLFAIAGMAQSSTKAYSEGDNLFNVGIGLGASYFGSGYSASLPVNPAISYERGITDEFSVGGELSYASYKYSLSDLFLTTPYTLKFTATYIGARGSYHLNELLDIPSKFDVYGGATLGYIILGVSNNMGDSATLGNGFGYGLFAGGKYYFAPKTAVYAELGYQSLSYLNIGVAFKF